MGHVDSFCAKYWKWILIVIVVFALYLRVSSLAVDSLWLDESISALASQGVLEHGYPSFVSGAHYDRAYVFHYLMAGSLWLFGGDFGVRFVSVVFGILTVIFGFYFARRFSGSSFTGLVFSLLLCLSSLEVIYSKQARMYQMLQLLYFFSFFLFYYFVIDKKKLFGRNWVGYCVVALFTVIAIDTHPLGLLLIPLYLVCFALQRQKNTWYYVGGALLFGVYLFLTRDVGFERVAWYSVLYGKSLLLFVPFLLVSLIGLIIGLIRDWKLHSVLLLSLLLPLFGAVFVNAFATRYVYVVVFGLLFYCAYCLSQIRFRLFVLSLLLVFYAGTALTFVPIVHPNLDLSSPTADYKSAYIYVSNLSPVISTLPSLAQWYGVTPAYYLNYSVTGPASEYWTSYNGRDVYSNATVVSSLVYPSYVVVDSQASVKLNLSFSRCVSSFTSYNIIVYYCE